MFLITKSGTASFHIVFAEDKFFKEEVQLGSFLRTIRPSRVRNEMENREESEAVTSSAPDDSVSAPSLKKNWRTPKCRMLRPLTNYSMFYDSLQTMECWSADPCFETSVAKYIFQTTLNTFEKRCSSEILPAVSFYTSELIDKNGFMSDTANDTIA